MADSFVAKLAIILNMHEHAIPQTIAFSYLRNIFKQHSSFYVNSNVSSERNSILLVLLFISLQHPYSYTKEIEN